MSRPIAPALRHELRRQTIDVSIGTALPWADHVGKVNLHTGALIQDFVAVHFAAVVAGHRFAHPVGWGLETAEKLSTTVLA